MATRKIAKVLRDMGPLMLIAINATTVTIQNAANT